MGLYIGSQRVCPIVKVKGDDTGGQYLVTVIDYDGTILKQDHLDTGDRMYLPPAPNHEGMVFQGWSCAAGIGSNIQDKWVTVTNSDITVGAYYDTTSGNTELDIELTPATGLTITCKLNGTKDWGDGTSDSTTSHTYSNYGAYTISAPSTNFGSLTSTSGVVGQRSNAINYWLRAARIGSKITTLNYSYAFQYCYGLRYISISKKNNTTIGTYFFRTSINIQALVIPEGIKTLNNYSLYYLSQAKYIALPSTLTTFGQYSISNASQLETLPIPSSVTSIQTSAFSSNTNLRTVTLPNITTLNSSTFSGCSALQYLKIPATVTTIGSSCFSNCRNCTYDFSSHTSVPSLTAGAFNGIYQASKILVPASLASTWKTTTNWAAYADYIVGV